MRSRIAGLLGALGAVVVTVAAVAAPVGAADLSELLGKVEAAYGGAEAVAKMASYRVEGTTTSAMRPGAGRVIRDYQAPDRIKVVVEYPDRSEVRYLDGDAAWRGGKTGVRPVEGPMKAAMEYQLLRSDLPGALLRHRDRLEDGGSVEHEGGSHHLLILQWSDAVQMKYWVDPTSFRITHVESVLAMGETSIVFATAFEDFRTVDGALFPFKETNYASGRHVADTQLEKLEFEPEELGPFGPVEPAAPEQEPGVIEG